MLIFAGKPRDKEVFKATSTPSIFWISLPLGIMALITFALGFFQNELAHFITNKEQTEAHVAWLLPFMMICISLLAFFVYYFYRRKPNLRDKISAQPLMKTIHQVLFNGYYIEKMITWFAKNIVVNIIAKSINWSEKHIIDKAVNNTTTISHYIFTTFGKTHSVKVSNQAGAMLLGALAIVVVIFIGSLS